MPIDTRRHFTPAVAIADYRCRGHDTPRGAEESVPVHRLVLIRRGAYWRFRDGVRVLAAPAHAIFDNAGHGYRVSHPLGSGDEGTCISYSDSLLRDALRQVDPDAAESERPFRMAHAPTTPAVLIPLQLFRQRARLGLVTDLDIEETALGVLTSLVQSGRPADRPTGRQHLGAERRRKELVEAACLMIACSLGKPHSLTAIAESLGCSPYHLTRIFRARVGMPMHRYLLWLRCCVALDRVADGEKSLSTLAFHLGFSSHSHFTEAFTRMMGMSPNGFRRSAEELLHH